MAALISVVGTLATGITLQRGILQIKRGLAALETDSVTGCPSAMMKIARSVTRSTAWPKSARSWRRTSGVRIACGPSDGWLRELRMKSQPLNSIRLSIQYLERRLHDNQVRSEDLLPVGFEEANEGTLFLDEMGELVPALQAKLLCPLQERVIERLGSNTSIPVDIRLVAATSRDLEAAVNTGSFRAKELDRFRLTRKGLQGKSQ